MHFTQHSKANAFNIGTFIRFCMQMRVENNNKAFVYRIYRHFTQQRGIQANVVERGGEETEAGFSPLQ